MQGNWIFLQKNEIALSFSGRKDFSNVMNTSDFYYDLPQEQIAQTPVEPRDSSRLMVLDRQSGQVTHRHFRDILDDLQPGDCLIVNDSRVLPSRIYGVKEETGAHVEFLLLKQRGKDEWEALAGPGRRAKPGARFTFGDGLLKAEVTEVLEGGNRVVKFEYEGNFFHILEQVGQMPLPPYITEKLQDQERYQTVYSKELGSAAAPTAGLHFTQELMAKLREKGVKIGYVTLHVGLGTFRPVKVENIEEHEMHSEYFEVTEEAAAKINAAKARGNRVIAVGTTSVRTLESASENGVLMAKQGDTKIFIKPGYQYQMVDSLITNFHLPGSTLLMLVSALYDREHILEAYEQAVKDEYRFFSFGDAMMIL